MTNSRAVLILGGGEAGLQAAVLLRDAGFDGAITLVGDEPHLPYRRPPLSKAYLKHGAADESILLRPEAYFARASIALRLGTRAVAIDRPRRRLVLHGGETLSYDHLILALGARNRRLAVEGVGLGGVFSLRTRDEAHALRPRLVAGQDVAVIGAGLIGLEFAAVALAAGMRVHVLEATGRIMRRVVSAEMSAFFAEAHVRRGLRLLMGARIRGLCGDAGHVTGVALDDGEIVRAGTVVISIGVEPNVELVAASGLAVANGIRVDEHLLTDDPDISAIGDCACFPSARYATSLRLESVQNAVDQANCVAERLAGRPAPYAALPWFWSDQGDLRLQIAGLTQGYDTAIRTGEPDSETFSILCFRKGHLLGVETVNRPTDHLLARRLLASGGDLHPEIVGQPDFDLRQHVTASRRP